MFRSRDNSTQVSLWLCMHAIYPSRTRGNIEQIKRFIYENASLLLPHGGVNLGKDRMGK